MIRAAKRFSLISPAISRRLSSSLVFSGYCVESSPEERTRLLVNNVLPGFDTVDSVNCRLYIHDSLNKTKGAVKLAMMMRNDLNTMARNKTISSTTQTSARLCDKFLKQWLGACFCLDSLELRRITFDHSSGNVLEKVARGESVHRVRSLSELKRRLHNGRRAFALFHHCLPEEPLVFVHVALTSNLATSIKQLDVFKDDSQPTHAMFYSINSPISALAGLDMGSFLIHEVVGNLQSTFPSLSTFSTLSPIPTFNHWLRSSQAHTAAKSDSALGQHLQHLQHLVSIYSNSHTEEGSAIDVDALEVYLGDEENKDQLKDTLVAVGAYYVTKVRTAFTESRGSTPMDPVARFHLRNGACVRSVNWMANSSQNGISTSCGMMVNYVYDLDLLEKRKLHFFAKSTVADSTDLVQMDPNVAKLLS